jgi:RimJ/RimL family protein N-acetyltransferase
MKEYTIFETERLILKPTSEEDADFFLKLVNAPKWLKYIGDRNLRTVEDSLTYIQNKILPQRARLGYSSYILIRKLEKDKIGICGLYDRKGLEGIDIGFALMPEYEGKGYAFEAINQLIHIAFSEFGINELKAITTKDNLSSQKLLEKLGLRLMGTTKLPDDDKIFLLYGIEK